MVDYYRPGTSNRYTISFRRKTMGLFDALKARIERTEQNAVSTPDEKDPEGQNAKERASHRADLAQEDLEWYRRRERGNKG